MGRMFRGLGQAAADMSFSPDGQTFTWYTDPNLPEPIDVFIKSDDAPQFHAWLQGRGGVESPNFIGPGNHYTVQMRSAGQPVMEISLDTTVSPYRPAVTLPPGAAPPPPADGGGEPPNGGGVPSGSWFEQSTNIFGVDIPNLGLVAGGGLLLLGVLRKKK